MKTFILFAAVLLVLSALPALHAQEPAEKPEPAKEEQEKKQDAGPSAAIMLEAQKYFPMEKGNWWEYKFRMQGGDDMPPLPVDEEKTTQKLTITEVTKSGCRMETSQGMFGMLPTKLEVKDGFLLQTVEGAGGDIKILKLPPRKDDKWTSSLSGPGGQREKIVINHTVAAIESVKTPAGEFQNAVKVVGTYKVPGGAFGPGDGDMEFAMTMWFAPGVGLVKFLAATPMGAITQELIKSQVTTGGEKVIATAAAASELVVIVGMKKPEIDKNLSEEEQKQLAEELAKKEEERLESGETVALSLVVEKVLKGKLEEKEIVVAANQLIGEGKWILFLGKLEKEGYPLIGPTLSAEKEILKKLDRILNPPRPKTLAEKIAAADFVVAGKAIVKEERPGFAYWVFEIEKVLKGDTSRTHVDVLVTRGLELTAGERYILALKAGEHHGRKLYEALGEKPDAFSKKKLEEYKEALGK